MLDDIYFHTFLLAGIFVTNTVYIHDHHCVVLDIYKKYDLHFCGHQ